MISFTCLLSYISCSLLIIASRCWNQESLCALYLKISNSTFCDFKIDTFGRLHFRFRHFIFLLICRSSLQSLDATSLMHYQTRPWRIVKPPNFSTQKQSTDLEVSAVFELKVIWYVLFIPQTSNYYNLIYNILFSSFVALDKVVNNFPAIFLKPKKSDSKNINNFISFQNLTLIFENKKFRSRKPNSHQSLRISFQSVYWV